MGPQPVGRGEEIDYDRIEKVLLASMGPQPVGRGEYVDLKHLLP